MVDQVRVSSRASAPADARDGRALGVPVLVRAFARAPGWARRGGHAAAAGRLLMLFTGAVVVVGALVLGPHDAIGGLAATSAVMLALVAASVAVPWHRYPRSTVAFPVAVLVALGSLGLHQERVTGAYVGLIPLCFVYLGLFHRGRTALVLLPLAWLSYLAMVPVLDASTGVRLAISGVTWWAITALLTLTTAYQRVVRRELYADARTDELTGLTNRRGLDERLAAVRPGDCLAIVDLDHFKRVNDAHGHVAGDAVLRRFGQLLGEHVRRRDVAARFGGEEFVLVLPRTEPVQALNLLRSLRTEWAEEDTGVTFSAGIAKATQGVAPGSVLASADVALYQAKNAGRDRIRIATEQLRAHDGAPA